MGAKDGRGIGADVPAVTETGRAAQPNSRFQRASDELIRRSLLWAIPTWVRPNHVTVVRFLLIPPLVYLLATGHDGWALIVFAVAAATDFIDGAMARTRDQITNLGIVIDPLADKLLIGVTLAMLGWQYLIIKIIVVALALEALGAVLGAAASLRARPDQKLVGANVFGKVKMALQSVGGGLFLVGSFLGLQGAVDIALVLLWAALLFALLSVAKILAVARKETRPGRPADEGARS